MLVFVGLGLYSWEDVSVHGLECIRAADVVYMEAYTSRLMGSTWEEMESAFQQPIRLLSRSDVEQSPEDLLREAERSLVVFCTGGDPMVSTTHTDLRLRAAKRGIPTRIIHGASIASAVCGLTGLQNYRFGKSCSIPYPSPSWAPTTPLETINVNQQMRLHTLVYLDITDDRCMTVAEGITQLEEMAGKRGTMLPPLLVGVARAGSPEPFVAAGTAERLKSIDFGPPLHILAVPADLHPVEEEYLRQFGAYEG